MSTCPECGQPMTSRPDRVHDRDGDQDVRLDRGALRDWVSVGRFTNLAEIGFFSELLTREKLPSQVRQHDEFSAVDGSWQAIYILQVPEDAAGQAVELLKTELAQEPPGGFGEEETASALLPAPQRNGMGLARSAIVILFVGGLAFVAGRSDIRQGEANAAATPALWQTLEQLPGPLVSEPGGAGTRYRIRFDLRSGRTLVERDRDGDGEFEPWRDYQRGRLVVDRDG